MKRTWDKLVFGVVVVVFSCRPLGAEEGLWTRWNPFRLFQRPAAKAETPATGAGPQSYGTPGPSWHAERPEQGDLAGSSRPLLSASSDARGDAPAGRSRPEAGGRRASGEPRQGASTEDGRPHVGVGIHGVPEQGTGRPFDSWDTARGGAGFSRMGGSPGGFRAAGGGAGVSLGTGIGCR